MKRAGWIPGTYCSVSTSRHQKRQLLDMDHVEMREGV